MPNLTRGAEALQMRRCGGASSLPINHNHDPASTSMLSVLSGVADEISAVEINQETDFSLGTLIAHSPHSHFHADLGRHAYPASTKTRIDH